MNLLSQAEADNSFILEDAVTGFGRLITYTLADGSTFSMLIGQVIRRGTKIDIATGLPVSSDEAAVTVRLSSFQTVFPGKLPTAGDKISTTDSTGATIIYKVPADGIQLDRTAGRITLVNLKKVTP